MFLVVVFEIIVRSNFFVFFLVEEEKISERGEREFLCVCVFGYNKDRPFIMCLLYECVRGSLYRVELSP